MLGVSEHGITALWYVLTKSIPVEIHFTRQSFSLETIYLWFIHRSKFRTNIVYKWFKMFSPDEVLTERTNVHWVQQYSLIRSLPIEAELSKSWANWVSEPFESMTQTTTEALSRGRRRPVAVELLFGLTVVSAGTLRHAASSDEPLWNRKMCLFKKCFSIRPFLKSAKWWVFQTCKHYLPKLLDLLSGLY